MVLYQKYRPRTFNGVVGQQQVKKPLIAAIKNGQVAHAYIFSGPRGTGKTTIARILSRAMNCLKKDDGQPCLACSNCQDASSVDVIEIDAASNRKIDDIRELREKIKFSPISSAYKIYIIDEVHMLTKEAFNALLKILEEPPKHAIFILATTEPERVPDTVLSRCQRFDFKPIGFKKMAKYLNKIAKKEKIEIDEKSLLMIAAASGGSLRDGLGILEQVAIGSDNKVTPKKVRNILGLVEHRVITKLIDLLIANKSKEAVELADELIMQGIEFSQIVETLSGYLRDLLVISMGSPDSTNLSDPELKKARVQVNKLSQVRIREWLSKTLEARDNGFESLPQLPLELLLIDLAGGKKRNINQKKKEQINREKISKEKKTEEEKEEILDSKNKDIKIKKEDWSAIIEELKKFNHSLSAVVSHCRFEGTSSGRLVISVDKKFYQKRIMDLSNIKKIQKAVKTVTNQSCQIDCKLKKQKSKFSQNSNAIDNLTKKAQEIF
jgi:DNA polymerase-3 subunit gamma/tau